MCIDGLIPFAPLEASAEEITDTIAATLERTQQVKDPKELARAIIADLRASGIKRILL